MVDSLLPPTTLTGAKEQYELTHQMREKIVLLSDGTLIVNENYQTDVNVLNKIIFFKNIIKPDGNPLTSDNQIKYESPDKVRSYYLDSIRSDFVDRATTIQREIADLIEIAYRRRATDIHMVLESPSTFVMFRILGELEVYRTLTYDEGNLMCTTLYNTMTTTSGSNFNSRVQQDANVQETFLPPELSGIRIATGPTQGNNYFMVMRLLPKGSSTQIGELGYSKSQLAMLREFKATHNGGITLCSGPTGSGKSTLLQAVAKEILLDYAGKINLITIEDPVEYPIMVETVVNNKPVRYTARQTAIPFTQDQALRRQYFNNAVVAAMRQDPNIIIVGEMRDSSTIEAAVTASVTGHPVLTTVHASNAITILDRLITMGGNRKLLLSPAIITGLISQVLVPTLCPQCKLLLTNNIDLISSDLLNRLNLVFADDLTGICIRGKGCDYSDGKHTCISGHIDRSVLAEMIAPDEEFLQFLRTDNLLAAQNYWLEKQGGYTMMCHGLAKVKAGLLDPMVLEAKLKRISPQINLDKAILDV